MNKSLATVIMVSLVGCAAETSPAPEQKKPTTVKAPSTPAPAADGDDATTTPDPNTACVTKGQPANEKGIGAYCDATAKCTGGTLCTGDFGAGEGASFCTKLCSDDAQCGTGAHCYHEARGSACVLDACMAK